MTAPDAAEVAREPKGFVAPLCPFDTLIERLNGAVDEAHAALTETKP